MKKDEFVIVRMDPDELIPFELNSKKHPPEQVTKIAESIARYGWDQPIVVDKDNVIIKGHGRRLAAKLLGPDHPKCKGGVPVLVRRDLTPEQVRAARMADNRSALSDIDPELLKKEMAGIEEELKGIFDDKELNFLNADLGTMDTSAFVTDMDSVLADQKKSVEEKTTAAAAADIPVAKALGFAKVPAAAQLAITAFLAKIEATTGLKGVEAFVAYASAQA